MISLSLQTLCEVVDGTFVGQAAQANTLINNINTDSRSLKSGEVFLALKGPNFDGHTFIQQAQNIGASAVIVEQNGLAQNQLTIAQIIVEDTRIALGKIGAFNKQQAAPKTVAITGSSGKTTLKEMVAAILSLLGKVLATQGNFNNEIGVPLTLLRLTKEDQFAVIELGANHLGEIAYTSDLVKPDVAIINNIAAAHLEGFGDLCGVARAKGEIFGGLTENGVAIFNQECKYADIWQWRLANKKVSHFTCTLANDNKQTSDQGSQAAVYSSNMALDSTGCARFTLHTPIGETEIQLTIPGQHNVCNAVAAAAVTLQMGATLADIQQGLAQVTPVKGRLNSTQYANNFTLIDDTYNANVGSIKAANDLLSSYPGKKILILGDMAELGSVARSCHQEVGQDAYDKGIDVLLTLGVLSQSSSDAFKANVLKDASQAAINAVNNAANKASQHFTAKEALLEYLKANYFQTAFNSNSHLNLSQRQNVASEACTVLVKGSRSAQMELIVEAIKDMQQADENNSPKTKIIKNSSENNKGKVSC